MIKTIPTKNVAIPKFALHPNRSCTYPPNMGAIMSVSTKVVVVYDQALENSAPLKQSLAMARFKTPQEPAPTPATSRDINNIVGEAAIEHIKVPIKKITKPSKIMSLRPNRSESGP